MSAALAAEWAKLRTVGETWWLTGAVVVVAVAGSAAMAATTHVSAHSSSGGPDPTRLALTGLDLAQAVVAVIAVLSVTDEYGTGMMRVSLAAIPRREALLAAKALCVAALALAAGVPAVGGCLVVGRALLPGAGVGPAHGYGLVSIASGATLRASVGALVYLALIGLLSLGVGAVVRDTAVATGSVLGLLYLPPLLALLLAGPWRRHIEQIAPMTAGLAVEATRHLGTEPDRPWLGLAILASWAVGGLFAGGVALRVRDA